MDTLFEPDAAGESEADAMHTHAGASARGQAPSGTSEPAPDVRGAAKPDREGTDIRPLAARVRPRALGEFVGQTHLLENASALRAAIEHGDPHSMILYGPPGSGKTTLARMVAERSQAIFEELSAVQAGRAEVRAVLERAAHRLATRGARTVFFLDEIHRFNKQ